VAQPKTSVTQHDFQHLLQAARTAGPRLLVRAGAEVPVFVLADVAAAATAAGFELVWAVGDPGLGTDRGRSGAP